jgi:deoxyribose-phosphate aldolase
MSAGQEGFVAGDAAVQDMARTALACMDLTSLGEADTALSVATLVARSQGPYGAPGALCVWPRFVAQVRGSLQALHGAGAPRVAAVANFPSGQEPLPAVLAQVRGIVADGGHEVDMVLDWQALRTGDAHAGRAAAATVRAVRNACRGAVLKLIIESGSLQDPELIRQACLIGLNEGVDFLKTSTGKTAVGATPKAARVMLECIASHPRGAHVGFKASGGVRTVRDAAVYINLVREILGAQACVPARFRIGASGLLDDVEGVLGGQASAATAGASY